MPKPGDPQSFNRYTYVNNNPLRYTDPSGHIPVEELARYYGYEDPNKFIESDIYAELTSDPEWWVMLSSRDVKVGDILSWVKNNECRQTMLVETDYGRLVWWDIDSQQSYELLETQNSSWKVWFNGDGEKSLGNYATSPGWERGTEGDDRFNVAPFLSLNWDGNGKVFMQQNLDFVQISGDLTIICAFSAILGPKLGIAMLLTMAVNAGMIYETYVQEKWVESAKPVMREYPMPWEDPEVIGYP